MDDFILLQGEAGIYNVFEAIGSIETTAEILETLEPFGLTGFVRSAKIAIDKSSNPLHQKLKRSELASPNNY